MAAREAVIHFLIDEDLHRKFKAKCAAEGKTMKAVIVEMIRNYVKEWGKKWKKNGNGA